MNSRDKGKRGEREFSQYLTGRGIKSRRGAQYSGGPESPDVVSDVPIHWEVKFTEVFKPYDWIEQTQRDCPGEKLKVVAFRKKRGDWLAILKMGDFLDVYTKTHGSIRVDDPVTDLSSGESS